MNRNHAPNIMFGILLVLCGVIWIASNLFKLNIDFGLLWPAFILVPGLLMWVGYLFNSDKENSFGMLIPANILTFLGLTFFVNVLVDRFLHFGAIWAWTVFMYPGSVAIAFWITWLFSIRKNSLVVPAVILSFISFLLLCLMSFALLFTENTEVTKYLWPLMLVCLGSFILTSPFWTRAFGHDKGADKEKWKEWGKNFGKEMEKMGDEMGSMMDGKAPKSSQPVEEAELIDAPEKDKAE